MYKFLFHYLFLILLGIAVEAIGFHEDKLGHPPAPNNPCFQRQDRRNYASFILLWIGKVTIGYVNIVTSRGLKSWDGSRILPAE